MVTNTAALVTGGAGFLGSFLIEGLLRQGKNVVALVRGPDAEERLLETLREIGVAEVEALRESGRISVLVGDVRFPGFGLTEAAQEVLAETVDAIWHCATSFKFQERYREEIAAHNITGTRNVLDFARRCNERRATPLFHVSTAYAAPLVDGFVQETLPSVDTPFRNQYEWSKQEAERLVGAYRQQYQLPVFIFRPSIIIGHSRSGHAVRFTGYYDVIRAIYLLTQSLEINLGSSFDRNLRLRIEAGERVFLNVVPVDFVVAAMWRLSQSYKGDAWIFNITNDDPPLLDFLFEQACAPLSVSGIELVETESFTRQPMSGLERIFNRKTQFQASYLLDGPLFDNTHFRAIVPENVLPCPRADELLMRRVNEYYYALLNRQFGAPERKIPVALSRAIPLSTGTEVQHEIAL